MTRPADWLPSYRLADYEREIAAATHGEAQGGTLPGARPPASGRDKITSYQSGDRLAAWLDRHGHRVEWACFGGVMLMLCIMGGVILAGLV